MGYETNNFIYNLGSMFYIVCLLIFSLILVGFSSISYFSDIRQKLVNKFQLKKYSAYKMVLLNSMFLVFFEGYIEILLSCYLNNEGSVRETKSDKFSFGISYFFGFVCVIIVPLSLFYMMSRR